MADDTATAKPSDEKDLKAAQDEWKLSDGAFSEQRTNEVEDQKFESGQHWTEAELAWRKDKSEPSFTVDQISGQVAKVTNQPVDRIIVKPNGGGADPTSAAYWQGICRRIENLSGAEDIYKYARRHAAVMGRGFWRVRADYFNAIDAKPGAQYDLSVFEQDIRIEAILNQHSVHEDPRCRTLDFSDQRFCIITDDLLWDDFKALYPKATKTSLSGLQGVFASTADFPPQWGSEKTVRVAERYYIVDVDVPLCVLKPGTNIDGRILPKPLVVTKDPKRPYPSEWILTEHTFKVPTVKWMKYTAGEVLERADVPGRYIPVVKIVGERRLIEGKVDYRGMIRMAKGPQRLVNFMESRLASTVDLAAYDTWVTEYSTTADFPEWDDISATRPNRLNWKATQDGNGNYLPKPERVSTAPNIAAIAVAAQRAAMALRSVLGVPDVTPDELRPEQSGKAIKARQLEQSQSTSHYGEATKGGIRQTGRIIISMGREVYTWPRILRINGADEKEIPLTVYNGAGQKGDAEGMAAQQASQQQQQQKHMLDVSLADFDISLAAGKGQQTGREETVDIIEKVLPILPPPMQMKAVPILIKNLDSPGMAELASTLEPKQEPDMVPREEAEKAQMVIDHLTKVVEQLQQQIEAKTAELRSKEAIASENNQTKLLIEDMKADLEKLRMQLDHQAEQQRIHESAMARREGHLHDAAMESGRIAATPKPTEGAGV